MKKNFRANGIEPLNKKELSSYRSLLLLMLDILSSSEKDEYEKVIIDFMNTLGSYSTEKQDYSLKFFLKAIDEDPFLCFMVKTRIRQVSYEAQIRILEHMKAIWLEEVFLIQKLSHIAYVEHIWIKEYGSSPFDIVLPTKFILRSLMFEKTGSNMQLEDFLAAPSNISGNAPITKIKKIEAFV